MPRMTIKKMAADLNLSIAAVSAALGTQSTTKVSPATAERVQEYAKKVNYRPSLLGKAMRSQRLRQAGMLVESNYRHQYRRPPVVEMPAIFGLNDFLRSREWQLNIVEDDGPRAGGDPLPRYLRESGLDGLVVCCTSVLRNELLEQDFARFSIPAVFLNAVSEYNCVSIDDRAGTSMAVRHLIELGHRNLLFVGISSCHHYSMPERERGYRETLEAAGLSAPVYLLEEGTDAQKQFYDSRIASNHGARRQFVKEGYLKQRPTGIVCYDDGVALNVMKALHEAGYSVPEDVSIVGYNDMPFMDMLPTSLTTISADFYTMGQIAGQLLLDLIEGREARIPSPVIKPELIVRQSTSPLLPHKKRSSKKTNP